SHHVFVGNPEGQLLQGRRQLVHGGAEDAPQGVLLVKEAQIKDVQGPKGEGSLEDRMGKLEQEVFKYKKMAERKVDIFHKIVSELIAEHEKETSKLWATSSHFTTPPTNSKLNSMTFRIKRNSLRRKIDAIVTAIKLDIISITIIIIFIIITAVSTAAHRHRCSNLGLILIV
ncbi:hypothetical protein QYE76_045747, partial [Lolium multiflorum]